MILTSQNFTKNDQNVFYTVKNKKVYFLKIFCELFKVRKKFEYIQIPENIGTGTLLRAVKS